MNTSQFIFRDTVFSFIMHIDCVPDLPYYVFVDLIDKELINSFGREITIKTDFETSLPQKDDYRALTELREAIFDAIKANPEFIFVKSKKGTINDKLIHSR